MRRRLTPHLVGGHGELQQVIILEVIIPRMARTESNNTRSIIIARYYYCQYCLASRIVASRIITFLRGNKVVRRQLIGRES